MDFEDYDYEDVNDMGDFQMEAKAFERVGPSGKLAELLSTGMVPDLTKGRIDRSYTQEDRFLIAVDALARKMEGDGLVKISQADIDDMLEKTRFVSGLKYKNPTAYILGYVATGGGRNLDKNNVLHVIDKILPEIPKDKGIAPADVVRYARFWKNFL